jgi:biopolymer transport protein ExbD/biopolymer transport protein TolR
MAISPGPKNAGEVAPQMNVTPLVDVVLVLLITFMVITPLLTRTFWIHVPEQRAEEVDPTTLDKHDAPLVLHVGPATSIAVNGSEVPLDELPARLRRIFAARDDHVLFVDADDAAGYAFVMSVMDRARDGGATTIALLTEPLEAPPL